MKVLINEKIVFLDMPKNASTSIDHALKDKAQISLMGLPSIKHLDYQDYEKYIYPLLKPMKLEIICLMREPISWLNSWYRYRQRRELRNPNHPNHKNSTYTLSFEEFIKEFISDNPAPYANLKSQYEFMMDKHEKIGIDKVFIYERMELFEKYMANKITGFTLEKKNVSPVKSKKLLSEPLEKALRQYLSRDFQLYEYLKNKEIKNAKNKIFK